MFDSILLLTAMKEEETAVLKRLNRVPDAVLTFGRGNPTTLKHFKSGSFNLYLVQSGMGPVNASVHVQRILDQLKVDLVILLGVAGSIVESLQIGDLVVSTQVMQHDYFSSLESGDHRMKAGDLILNENDLESCNPLYAAEIKVLKFMEERLKMKFTQGVVMSGNEFVGTALRKKQIQSLHKQSLVVEMEACGVAQVSHQNGVPFVVAKTVADRLHADHSIESDFIKCLNSAAANASQVVHDLFSDRLG